MSELSRLLNTPQVWEFEGRPYRVAACTLEVEGAFEAWLENSASEAVERGRARYGDAWAEKVYAVWLEQCASNAYCFGGALWEKAVRTFSGQKMLAYLRISKAHPDFDAAVLDRAKDDPVAWGRLLRIIIVEYFARGKADPKDPAAPDAPPDPAGSPSTSGG